MGVFVCLVAAWTQIAESISVYHLLGFPSEGGPPAATLAASLESEVLALWPPSSRDAPSQEARMMLSQLPGIDFSPLLLTPTKCVVLVALQYFAVYTALLVVRTTKQVWQVASTDSDGKSPAPMSVVRAALEEVAASADLLPMVAALFLATGQLVENTAPGESHEWVSSIMTGVVTSGVASMVISFWISVRTQLGFSHANWGASLFQPLGSLATIINYLCVTAVIAALAWLHKPGSQEAPELMSVCLISLAMQYFASYTALLIASFIDKLGYRGVNSSLALEAARAASSEQRLGPMLSVLVMVLHCRSTVMRRSTLDPWTQNFCLACIFGLFMQTLLSASAAYLAGSDLRRRFPAWLESIAMLRWGVMCCVYAAAVCAAVSELYRPSVATSSVLMVTLCYVSQYFLVHMSCLIVDVVQEVRDHQDADIEARESQGLRQEPRSFTKRLACAFAVVKDAVMFCPMASALLLADAMRATQFHGYANPPVPSQEYMIVGMWASLIQLSVSLMVAVLVMTPEARLGSKLELEQQKLKQACASFLVFASAIA
eukprot:CAMPEP_0197655632 /NCGR_PEP_ID=MMETSP1338-20131121/39566_1 /TAXON_ID=43686 ORGANISM="Pelagodinium beii, Strain RCC1491" /NCGR_SAMPLE_ID=MMETSP1338 /ASSEMBLY_ACC=CAM_ASM_000754 /LENGTH=545 /DNA_ID=CAMNT_0043231313 /DNA_START=116 /DNA_END=1754 /DNA_ORIENTATION=-